MPIWPLKVCHQLTAKRHQSLQRSKTKELENCKLLAGTRHEHAPPHLLAHDNFIRLVVLESQGVDAGRSLKRNLRDVRKELRLGSLRWLLHGRCKQGALPQQQRVEAWAGIEATKPGAKMGRVVVVGQSWRKLR